MRDQRGYYSKFVVIRAETEEIVTDDTFTLIPSRDPHAAIALAAYAASCEAENHDLAIELMQLLAKHGHGRIASTVRTMQADKPKVQVDITRSGPAQ